METSQPENHDHLFFHHQRNPVRQYRRVRKEPEELPQALRYFKYANLNPRIAAFLGKQDPKSLLKRAKGGKPDGKEVVASAPSVGVGLLGGEFRNDLSMEARSLLPDIGKGMGHLSFEDDQFAHSRLSFTNEADDPQRYQFEETTFAAPNILRELADTLNRFQIAFKEYAQRTTLYDPETGDPVATESTSPSILLPPAVTTLLCQGWKDVTAGATFASRVWQSTAYQAEYKYAATMQSAKQEAAQATLNNLGMPKVLTPGLGEKTGPTISSGLKSIFDLLEESRNKTHSKRDGANADSRTMTELKKSKAISKDIALLGVSGSVAVKNKDRSMKSTVNLLTGQQEETFAKVPRHGGSAVFSFNLSSKKAQEEGWITKESEPEPGERNMWLWAAARLRSVIKEKEEEAELAKSKGCYKPMLLRYYGDSRRETLMKLYKKGGESDGKSTPAVVHSLLPGKKHGVPKIPQLSKLYSGGKDKFMVQLPDGSITVYYAKTEELAIMASAVPDEPGQVYVNCYDNDEAKTCLASFTPYGESCCYHKNGAPGLILTDVGGLLKSEDGSVVKKWEWDSEDSKRKENILFNLNKEMYVRVISKSNILLNFCSNRETIKIPVGAKPNVVPPRHSAELGNLQSGLPLTSKAAEELGNLHRGAKPKTASPFKSRKNQFAKKWLRKPAEIEELRRSTDPPMRFEFESQADRELQRLKSKTRLLVDHWLENYRLAVGVRSPALKHMSSKTVVEQTCCFLPNKKVTIILVYLIIVFACLLFQIRTVNRDIQSARERKVSSLSDSEFGDKDGKFQSFRCPSAPPRHMVPGPNSITVKEEKKKTFPLSSTKKTEPHVRIDESPSHATTSKSGKIRSSLSAGTVASGSQRIALHSSRSPQRGHKSILRTTSVSSAPSSREKSWSPVNDCCPVATRNRLLVPVDKQNLAESKYFCKCSNNHMPLICDLEFDHFLHLVVPVAQLVVICVINSLYPKASPHDGMLDRLYIENNRNRSNPCKQGRNDQYRLLRYDLAIAKLGTQRSNPLLLGRHNVVPGMTLMYCGGRLLFADHIFNGYGNAKNDIRKQIFRTKREYFRGRSLPDDFRFTPGQGRPGARSAWGGEMGGAGVDRKGSPGMFFRNPTTLLGPGKKAKSAGINITSAALLDVSQSSSDLTSRSSDVVLMPASKSFNTARDFVQFSLSSQIYVPPLPRPTKRRTPTLEVPVRFFPTKSSTSRSVPKSGNSVSSNDVKNFARLQTVK